MNIASILFLVVMAAGCAEVADADSGEDSAPIIGGTRTSAYPAVMALFASRGDGTGSLCTASLIAPRVLLTAAHCVTPSEVGPGVQFSVFSGTDFRARKGAMIAVAEVMHDPAFSVNKLSSGHDIGAVILEQPLTTKPVPVNRRGDPDVLIGASVRLVGYGVDDGDAHSGAGLKRQTLSTLDGTTDRLLQIGDEAHGTCQGDSGGPALMAIDGKQTLVGLTSFGKVGCHEGSFHTRVDRYGSFIDDALEKGQ